ncbi:MAG TPA: ATP-binding protein [Kofleriaceae bacterium]|nr:ATP-binding protein [Kofleriaceae bacterium]
MTVRKKLMLMCAGALALQIASATAETYLSRRAAEHHAGNRAAHLQIDQLRKVQSGLIQQLKEVGDLSNETDVTEENDDLAQLAAAQARVDSGLRRFAELATGEETVRELAEVRAEQLAADQLAAEVKGLSTDVRALAAGVLGDRTDHAGRRSLDARFDHTMGWVAQLIAAEEQELVERDAAAERATDAATTMGWLAPLLAAFLLVTALGLVLRSVSRSLADLAEGATRVAAGDLDRPVPVRIDDELGVLAAAFNDMQLSLKARVAERDLALRDARFRDLSEAAPVAIAEIDRDGRAVYTNQRWDELTAGAAATDRTWTELVHPEDRERAAELGRTAASAPVELRLECGPRSAWVMAQVAALGEAGDHLILALVDITQQKHAIAQAEEMSRELLAVSRRAGMAEISAGVLHNVGNVLNSVLVSATTLREQLHGARIANLVKAARMLEEQGGDLAGFLATDRGKLLPPYLVQAAGQVASDMAASGEDLVRIEKGIDHIRAIISTQQSYAKATARTEALHVAEVVEDVLRMNAAAFQGNALRIVRHFDVDPELVSDRHKIMQVLVNLLGNARIALADAGDAIQDPTIEITTRMTDSGALALVVTDNGVGITPVNLARLFEHGFTTRKTGHGFGLHSSAQAAKELGGRIAVHSPGAGLGATFTLELPLGAEIAA